LVFVTRHKEVHFAHIDEEGGNLLYCVVVSAGSVMVHYVAQLVHASVGFVSERLHILAMCYAIPTDKIWPGSVSIFGPVSRGFRSQFKGIESAQKNNRLNNKKSSK
jgi:hypothetical protein